MWNKMVEQPLAHPQYNINLHLTRKPMILQYIILGFWLVAACLIAYYLTYNMVILEIIQAGILPANLDWTLYTAGGFGILGLSALLLSPDQV
jgi:hypothetical protein